MSHLFDANDIAAFFYCAFLALALISPFLPLSLIWRSAAVSMVALAGGRLIEGPVHWSDQNVGYALGTALFWLFLLAVSAALAVRVGIATALGGRFARPSVTEGCWCAALDRAALAFTGGVAGLVVVLVLANALSGSSGGVALDLGVALAAIAATVFVAARFEAPIATPATALCIVVAAIALVGSGQPERIIQGAETFAGGRPWCLVGQTKAAPISAMTQLGFFSLRKGSPDPHVAVLVLDGQDLTGAHWSIRQQRFVRGLGTSVPACHPRFDYAEALRDGRLGPNSFAIGPSVFSVPPEFHPVAYPDRLSIRSDMLTGPGGTSPYISERIEINTKGPRHYVPDDGESLDVIPSLTNIETEVFEAGEERHFVGTEPGTGRKVVLSCLRGAYVDRNCFAEVTDKLVTYSFYLPLSKLKQWSEATDRVIAMFERLRVRDRS